MRSYRVIALTPVLFAATTLCASVSPAAASLLISVDKTTQHMTVAVDGVPRYYWPVSTGRIGYETPSGKFTAFRMEKDHFSKEYDDAPMPNSIFFTMKGHAIHGTNEVRHLGTAYSHGCVRLSVAHSAKLWDLVKEEGLPNTHVVITGKEAPLTKEPLVAKRGRAAPPLPAEADDVYGPTYAANPYPAERPVRDRDDYYDMPNNRQVYTPRHVYTSRRVYRVVPEYQERAPAYEGYYTYR